MLDKYKVIAELLDTAREINNFVSQQRRDYSPLNMSQEVFEIQLNYVISRIRIISQYYKLDLLSLAKSRFEIALLQANTNDPYLRLLEIGSAILKLVDDVNRLD